MGAKRYDFTGWATKNDLLCSDGRTIRKDAFKDDDGHTVPLVWQHQHNDPENVLGHALLENRPEGVYAYCTFNNTDSGKRAKELVNNRDINSLSIYANKLKQQSGNVLHGCIREVSLVLAGANPGALIDYPVLEHSDGSIEEEFSEAFIYTGEDLYISHADDSEEDGDEETEEKPAKKDDKTVKEILDTFTDEQRNLLVFITMAAMNGLDADDFKDAKASSKQTDEHANSDEKTLKDIFDTMNEEQKAVLNYIVTKALEEKESSNDKSVEEDKMEETEEMKHNVFDNDDNMEEAVISHDDMKTIVENAKRVGSFKAAFTNYVEDTLQHSIEEIDTLFPDAKNYTTTPEFVKRDDAWVSTVWNGVHKSPFSRVKTVFANITEDEARAKGYIKGKQKKEEVFGLLKRATTPQTVYKLQKFDRDDVIDITDFDVVAWVKGEMRTMLNEELARAIMVGDGRVSGAEDKINENNIRPIWTDDDFYTIHKTVTLASDASNYDKAEAIIEAALRARKDYKGSGTPDAFFDPDTLTTMLLAKDKMGRRIYNSTADLAAALRVKNIHEVPVFEGLSRTDSKDTKTHELLGIIVNLTDYNVGADKGGSVNLFDDFDIDYNRYSYLIETRCSGALIRPYSAIAIENVIE